MRIPFFSRLVFAVCTLLVQTACDQPGPNGNGGSGKKPSPVNPGPVNPRIATVISRLSVLELEDMQTCLVYKWQDAKTEWPEIAGGYLMSCLMKSTPVTNSDLNTQFEKDFIVLFHSVHDEALRPLPNIDGASILKKINLGVKK